MVAFLVTKSGVILGQKVYQNMHVAFQILFSID